MIRYSLYPKLADRHGMLCLRYHEGLERLSAGAKSRDEGFIRLAMVAHIRHAETNYDEMLSQGTDRHSAREQVQAEIDQVLDRWKAESSSGTG